MAMAALATTAKIRVTTTAAHCDKNNERSRSSLRLGFDFLGRQQAGQQSPGRAADRVNAESIKRVIVAQSRLQYGNRKIGQDGGRNSDKDRPARADKTARRSDHDESGHRASTETEHTGVPAEDFFQQTPGKRGYRRGQRGRW